MISDKAVEAFAFESTFGPRDPLTAMALAWTYSESRADTRRIVKTFVRNYTRFAPRALGVEARRILQEVREETA